MIKVLILRFSSIGDIVLTTPVIRTLKTQLDDAQIHYATKAVYQEMFELNPYIDKMHYLNGNLSKLIDELKREKFEYVIDLHHNLRTFRIKRALGVKAFSYNKLNIEKWLMVNFKINKLPGIHIVDRYMDTVKPLGVKMDALGLDYFIPEKDKVSLDILPWDFKGDMVVYAIGGQHTTKKLPMDRMVELCERINKPIVLLGGKEDFDTGEQLVDLLRQTSDAGERTHSPARIYNACGIFNLNQSASIIKQSRYVFTHDTGLMHIAAAFKKEIFSIWGNTIPAFGMYPFRSKFTVLENNKLDCRPCSKIGFKKCPKGHFKCMKELVFDFYLS